VQRALIQPRNAIAGGPPEWAAAHNNADKIQQAQRGLDLGKALGYTHKCGCCALEGASN
jgi:hypothetical protein